MWRSILLLLILPAGDACAYKPAPPKRHDVPSANRDFVLDVDPGANRLTVYAVGKRDQPLWSFQRPVWLQKYFLANDGKTVAVVASHFVPSDNLHDGVCIEFWNETGKVREHTFAELCPNPARSFFEGPVGLHWRKWYTEAESDGDMLRVKTTDEFEYEFSLEDGNIATRVRRVLHFDPKTEEIQNDKEAGPMVRRTYRDHRGRPRGV